MKKQKAQVLHIICVGLMLLMAFAVIRFAKKEPFENITLQTIEKNRPRTDATYGISENGVPLDIYQTWWSDRLPPGMKATVEELQRANPEFNYHLFTDEDCAAFIKQYFGDKVLRAFQCLKPGAFKADLWRYCVLYKNGGVYLDIKFITKQRLIDLIRKNSLLLINDQYPHIGCYWNGLMISQPGPPLLKACIDRAVELIEGREYGATELDITGPCLIGNVIKKIMPDYKSGYTFTTTMRHSGYHAVKEDATNLIIIEQYPTYREEQLQTQKTGHYLILWRNRDVYAC